MEGSAGDTALVGRHVESYGKLFAGLVMFCLAAFLSIGTAEVTARVFWRLCCDIPFFKPDQILFAFYPELRSTGDLPGSIPSVNRQMPAHGDGVYDILFLGGSVLHKNWSSVEMELREQLAYLGHTRVRVFNLAMPAHTSRDSLLKYATLGEARFDLVIVYHGINESRANNAPPAVFRADYGHYSWYANVNVLADYHGTTVFALPYTLRYLANNIYYNLRKDQYISTYSIPPEWIQYGREARSAESFRYNVSMILEIAAKRQDQILLMTFATYVPQNYSRAAFKRRQLDYALHRSPIEWWGLREHVLAAVAAHNGVVRTIAARHKNVLFLDQAKLMVKNNRYFNDICHLTTLGSVRFAANLLRVLPLR